MNVFPSFWNKMKEMILNGDVIICQAVYDEICKNKDKLSYWLKSIVDGTKLVLQVDETILSCLVTITNNVSNRVPPYRESAINIFNSSVDLLVLSTAKAYDFTIITEESFAPDCLNNVKIPNVCAVEGINCLNIYDFLSNENIVF